MPSWTGGITKAVVAGTIAAAGLVTGTGSAHAASNWTWITITTGHGVGLYSSPNAGSAKVGPDLWAPSEVDADCWVAGGQVGSDGDVWYHTAAQWDASRGSEQYDAWVFGPYVDGAAAFHNGTLPNCNS